MSKWLVCELLNKNGEYVKGSYYIDETQIYTNDDGCLRQIELKQSGYPDGSWIETARNIRIENHFIIAELQKKDGTWVEDYTMIRPGCRYVNDDGKFLAVLDESSCSRF